MKSITRALLLGGILSLLTFPLVFEAEAGRRVNKKIEVPGALKAELNTVLKAANELHKACYKKDEPKIAASLRSVIGSIDKAQQKSSLAASDRSHLTRILTAAKTELEMSQMQSGTSRQDSLKKAFNNLVQIAQIFSVDKYQIFFCPRDKSIWLQTGKKAQNPISPSLKNCGRLVR